MSNPNWTLSLRSHIWIFNVNRGLSIFIRTALNQGIIYDFGSSDDFKPTEFLKEKILPYLDKYNNCFTAQSIISHPHADHISAISSELNDKNSLLYSSLLTCPHDKDDGSEKPESIDWERIKLPKGSEQIN